jgi:hypothetical protein
MMNFNGCGRMRSWLNFKVLSQNLPEVTEGNHDKPQTGYPVSGPEFEPGTFRIRRGNNFLLFASPKEEILPKEPVSQTPSTCVHLSG